TGVYQVLAVVEDDEGVALTQPVHHRLDRRPASLFAIAQRRGDQLGHERWIREAGEVHPAAGLKAWGDTGRDLSREPRLPGAADAGERHQAGGLQQVVHSRDFSFTADERRE